MNLNNNIIYFIFSDGSIHSGSSGPAGSTNRPHSRCTPTPQPTPQQLRPGSSLSQVQLRPGSALSTHSSLVTSTAGGLYGTVTAGQYGLNHPAAAGHHQPIYGSLRGRPVSAVNLPVQQHMTAAAGVTVQPQMTAAGGGVTSSNSSCECPMCYHSIKNPCTECGCPSSSMSKVID